MEQWRDIEGYGGQYQISSEGRLRSLYRECLIGKGKRGIVYKERILSPSTNNAGYSIYVLKDKESHPKIHTIHRLVAEAFIPNPNNLSDVNHIDEDKKNNKVSNLEWMSHRDNCNYGTVLDRRSKAMTKPQHKVSSKRYHNEVIINETGESLGTAIEAAAILNMKRDRVYDIIRNKKTIEYNGSPITLRLERIMDIDVTYIANPKYLS